MTEKEIREVIRELCQELDQRARRAVRKVVLPTVMGAGLALSGCSDPPVALYGVPDGGPSMEAGPDAAYGLPPPDGLGTDQVVPRPDAVYALPFDMKTDMGPPIPPYMAPDIGPQPLYMPPFVDFGPPTPDYMVPDDGGMAPLYAVPDPDLKQS